MSSDLFKKIKDLAEGAGAKVVPVGPGSDHTISIGPDGNASSAASVSSFDFSRHPLRKIPKVKDKELEDRLSRLRSVMVVDHIFFGNLLMNTPIIITEEPAITTAATDGETIVFGKDFARTLTNSELLFVLAHELMHIVFDHCIRMKDQGYNYKRWNYAGDYIINKHLKDEKIGKMPSIGLYSEELFAAGGGTTDGVYALLKDRPEACQGGFDQLGTLKGSASEVSNKQAEVKMRVSQAAQAAKMFGNLSAGMEQLIGEILKPKVLWQDVLRRFLTKAKTDERSFARPNRRFAQQGIFTPTRSGELMGEIIFCVDCSGSIGPCEIDQFAAEIRKAQEDTLPEKIHVMYFDTEVLKHDEFSRDEEVKVHPIGGGGTMFSPVFEDIEQKNVDPVVCVFLTDLCCSDFGPAPDFPVLWVSTDEGEAPFGEVVLMDNDLS